MQSRSGLVSTSRFEKYIEKNKEKIILRSKSWDFVFKEKWNLKSSQQHFVLFLKLSFSFLKKHAKRTQSSVGANVEIMLSELIPVMVSIWNITI